MNIEIKKFYFLLYILNEFSKNVASMDFQHGNQDKLLLSKLLDSLNVATNKEKLFDVTLRLLESVCVCMQETLIRKERLLFEGETNSFKNECDQKSQIDLYKSIYNQTCINLRQELLDKIAVKQKEEFSDNILSKEIFHTDIQPRNKNQNISKDLDGHFDVLLQSLISTRNYQKYNIQKHNLYRNKLFFDNDRENSIIIIITLRPNITLKGIINESLLNETLLTNTPINIDIINKSIALSNNEIIKLDHVEKCHLYSIYFFLNESKTHNTIKVLKVLPLKGTIKIYIDALTGHQHSDFLTKCCNNDYVPLCENIIFRRQNEKLPKSTINEHHEVDSYKETILNIKKLVEQLSKKANLKDVTIINNRLNDRNYCYLEYMYNKTQYDITVKKIAKVFDKSENTVIFPGKLNSSFENFIYSQKTSRNNWDKFYFHKPETYTKDTISSSKSSIATPVTNIAFRNSIANYIQKDIKNITKILAANSKNLLFTTELELFHTTPFQRKRLDIKSSLDKLILPKLASGNEVNNALNISKLYTKKNLPPRLISKISCFNIVASETKKNSITQNKLTKSNNTNITSADESQSSEMKKIKNISRDLQNLNEKTTATNKYLSRGTKSFIENVNKISSVLNEKVTKQGLVLNNSDIETKINIIVNTKNNTNFIKNKLPSDNRTISNFEKENDTIELMKKISTTLFEKRIFKYKLNSMETTSSMQFIKNYRHIKSSSATIPSTVATLTLERKESNLYNLNNFYTEKYLPPVTKIVYNTSFSSRITKNKPFYKINNKTNTYLSKKYLKRYGSIQNIFKDKKVNYLFSESDFVSKKAIKKSEFDSPVAVHLNTPPNFKSSFKSKDVKNNPAMAIAVHYKKSENKSFENNLKEYNKATYKHNSSKRQGTSPFQHSLPFYTKSILENISKKYDSALLKKENTLVPNQDLRRNNHGIAYMMTHNTSSEKIKTLNLMKNRVMAKIFEPTQHETTNYYKSVPKISSKEKIYISKMSKTWLPNSLKFSTLNNNIKNGKVTRSIAKISFKYKPDSNKATKYITKEKPIPLHRMIIDNAVTVSSSKNIENQNLYKTISSLVTSAKFNKVHTPIPTETHWLSVLNKRSSSMDYGLFPFSENVNNTLHTNFRSLNTSTELNQEHNPVTEKICISILTNSQRSQGDNLLSSDENNNTLYTTTRILATDEEFNRNPKNKSIKTAKNMFEALNKSQSSQNYSLRSFSDDINHNLYIPARILDTSSEFGQEYETKMTDDINWISLLNNTQSPQHYSLWLSTDDINKTLYTTVKSLENDAKFDQEARAKSTDIHWISVLNNSQSSHNSVFSSSDYNNNNLNTTARSFHISAEFNQEHEPITPEINWMNVLKKSHSLKNYSVWSSSDDITKSLYTTARSLDTLAELDQENKGNIIENNMICVLNSSQNSRAYSSLSSSQDINNNLYKTARSLDNSSTEFETGNKTKSTQNNAINSSQSSQQYSSLSFSDDINNSFYTTAWSFDTSAEYDQENKTITPEINRFSVLNNTKSLHHNLLSSRDELNNILYTTAGTLDTSAEFDRENKTKMIVINRINALYNSQNPKDYSLLQSSTDIYNTLHTIAGSLNTGPIVVHEHKQITTEKNLIIELNKSQSPKDYNLLSSSGDVNSTLYTTARKSNISTGFDRDNKTKRTEMNRAVALNNSQNPKDYSLLSSSDDVNSALYTTAKRSNISKGFDQENKTKRKEMNRINALNNSQSSQKYNLLTSSDDVNSTLYTTARKSNVSTEFDQENKAKKKEINRINALNRSLNAKDYSLLLSSTDINNTLYTTAASLYTSPVVGQEHKQVTTETNRIIALNKIQSPQDYNLLSSSDDVNSTLYTTARSNINTGFDQDNKTKKTKISQINVINNDQSSQEYNLLSTTDHINNTLLTSTSLHIIPEFEYRPITTERNWISTLNNSRSSQVYSLLTFSNYNNNTLYTFNTTPRNLHSSAEFDEGQKTKTTEINWISVINSRQSSQEYSSLSSSDDINNSLYTTSRSLDASSEFDLGNKKNSTQLNWISAINKGQSLQAYSSLSFSGHIFNSLYTTAGSLETNTEFVQENRPIPTERSWIGVLYNSQSSQDYSLFSASVDINNALYTTVRTLDPSAENDQENKTITTEINRISVLNNAQSFQQYNLLSSPSDDINNSLYTIAGSLNTSAKFEKENRTKTTQIYQIRLLNDRQTTEDYSLLSSSDDIVDTLYTTPTSLENSPEFSQEHKPITIKRNWIIELNKSQSAQSSSDDINKTVYTTAGSLFTSPDQENNNKQITTEKNWISVLQKSQRSQNYSLLPYSNDINKTLYKNDKSFDSSAKFRRENKTNIKEFNLISVLNNSQSSQHYSLFLSGNDTINPLCTSTESLDTSAEFDQDNKTNTTEINRINILKMSQSLHDSSLLSPSYDTNKTFYTTARILYISPLVNQEHKQITNDKKLISVLKISQSTAKYNLLSSGNDINKSTTAGSWDINAEFDQEHGPIMTEKNWISVINNSQSSQDYTLLSSSDDINSTLYTTTTRSDTSAEFDREHKTNRMETDRWTLNNGQSSRDNGLLFSSNYINNTLYTTPRSFDTKAEFAQENKTNIIEINLIKLLNNSQSSEKYNLVSSSDDINRTFYTTTRNLRTSAEYDQGHKTKSTKKNWSSVINRSQSSQDYSLLSFSDDINNSLFTTARSLDTSVKFDQENKTKATEIIRINVLDNSRRSQDYSFFSSSDHVNSTLYTTAKRSDNSTEPGQENKTKTTEINQINVLNSAHSSEKYNLLSSSDDINHTLYTATTKSLDNNPEFDQDHKPITSERNWLLLNRSQGPQDYSLLPFSDDINKTFYTNARSFDSSTKFYQENKTNITNIMFNSALNTRQSSLDNRLFSSTDDIKNALYTTVRTLDTSGEYDQEIKTITTELNQISVLNNTQSSQQYNLLSSPSDDINNSLYTTAWSLDNSAQFDLGNMKNTTQINCFSVINSHQSLQAYSSLSFSDGINNSVYTTASSLDTNAEFVQEYSPITIKRNWITVLNNSQISKVYSLLPSSDNMNNSLYANTKSLDTSAEIDQEYRPITTERNWISLLHNNITDSFLSSTGDFNGNRSNISPEFNQENKTKTAEINRTNVLNNSQSLQDYISSSSGDYINQILYTTVRSLEPSAELDQEQKAITTQTNWISVLNNNHSLQDYGKKIFPTFSSHNFSLWPITTDINEISVFNDIRDSQDYSLQSSSNYINNTLYQTVKYTHDFEKTETITKYDIFQIDKKRTEEQFTKFATAKMNLLNTNLNESTEMITPANKSQISYSNKDVSNKKEQENYIKATALSRKITGFIISQQKVPMNSMEIVSIQEGKNTRLGAGKENDSHTLASFKATPLTTKLESQSTRMTRPNFTFSALRSKNKTKFTTTSKDFEPIRNIKLKSISGKPIDLNSQNNYVQDLPKELEQIKLSTYSANISYVNNITGPYNYKEIINLFPNHSPSTIKSSTIKNNFKPSKHEKNNILNSFLTKNTKVSVGIELLATTSVKPFFNSNIPNFKSVNYLDQKDKNSQTNFFNTKPYFVKGHLRQKTSISKPNTIKNSSIIMNSVLFDNGNKNTSNTPNKTSKLGTKALNNLNTKSLQTRKLINRITQVYQRNSVLKTTKRIKTIKYNTYKPTEEDIDSITASTQTFYKSIRRNFESSVLSTTKPSKEIFNLMTNPLRIMAPTKRSFKKKQKKISRIKNKYNTDSKNLKMADKYKEGLLDPFGEINHYPIKILPSNTQRKVVKRINFSKNTNILTMNTNDFYSRRRNPNHLGTSPQTKYNDLIQNPVKVIPKPYIIRPKFDKTEYPVKTREEYFSRKPLYVSYDTDFYREDFQTHHRSKALSLREKVNHIRHSVPTPLHDEPEKVIERPSYLPPNTKPKFLRHRVDYIRNFIYNNDFIKPTRFPITSYLIETTTSMNDQPYQDPFFYFRRSGWYNEKLPTGESTTIKAPTRRPRRTIFFLSPTVPYYRYF